MRSPIRRPALAVLAAAAALTLSGCSGGDADKPAATASSSSASPSPSSTVKVPDGTEVTDQGSKLSFGETADVVYEPTRADGSVLQITVGSVRRGTLKDFDGFILDDDYIKKASYYYAKVTVKNVGEGDVGGVPVPLWGVNKANTLLPPVNFTTTFPRCPSKPLPKRFGRDKSVKTCLVFLSPDHGSLESVSYRPSQEFNPITWTGTVAPAKKAEKKG